ncbi:helix-turn-helix transcriptional regulator [Saccharothrix australiensis]|uniref:helix-turn-helix transcriptional regulator n=1 Tax=Saccharothrix australiensis TaxID=2072 RepID=UPI001477538A|nr:LuxR family transcriptional regulator [Saccharothrix australiensis]
MIERNDHLAALGERLASASRGEGSVVVAAGPAGSGKTALLMEACGSAARSGFGLLGATASADERDLPLGLIGQLFANAQLTPAEREVMATHLRTPIGQGGLLPAHAVYELGNLLFTLAARKPLLVHVDDVRHADDASLQCLLFLARRIRTSGIVLVLSDMPSRRSGHQPFRSDLLRQPHGHRLTLGPLSRQGALRVVADRTGELDEQLAADCHAVSGGNPALLHAALDDRELFSTSGFEQTDAVALGHGETFRQAVLDCLDRYEPAVAAVARAMAVLDECGTPELIAGLLDTDVDLVGIPLGDLERAGLACNGALRHAAIRAAVLAHTPAAELTDLNRRAARLLHRHSASPTVVARRLLALDDQPTPWTVAVLCEAANEAFTADEADFAHRCLELARRAAGDERQRAEIAAQLAGMEWQLPEFNVARHTAQLDTVLEEVRAGGRHRATLVRYLLRYGCFDLAERALAVIGADPDDVDEVELQAVRTLVAVSYPPLAEHLAAEWPPGAGPSPAVRADPLVRTAGTLRDVLRRCADDDSLAGAEQVLRTARLTSGSFEQVECALLALVYADELGRAAAACELVESRAERTGSAAWRARLAALRAEIALRRGELCAARHHADRALALLPEQAWGVAVAGPLSVLLMSATLTGDLVTAADVVTRPVPDEVFRTRFGLHYLYARGEYHLATNQVHAALGDFLVCGELMRDWGIDLPGLAPWRSGAARAHLRMGKTDRARRLVDEQAARIGSGSPRSRGITLRQLAAVGDAKARPALLRQAVEELQSAEDRVELAYALTDLGQSYHALGEHRRARMMFRRAGHMAEEQRVVPLLNRLAHDFPELRRLELVEDDEEASARITVLSDAERRVAALAAAGYTNREIANKLYITVSTVEQHLTRVYRKLNLAGRNELLSDLGALVTTSA